MAYDGLNQGWTVNQDSVKNKTKKKNPPHPIMIYSGEYRNVLNNTGFYC